MVARIWREQGLPPGTVDQNVIKAVADHLWKGVGEGYGKSLSDVDYDTPDFAMLSSLQKNVWHFSGARNYHQLRELGAALVGVDGKLRSKEEFIEAAEKIIGKYDKRFLAAEYNLAVAGAQMAGKWVDIENNAATFPLLEFDAVLDTQTTALCRSLHGTVLPVGHPFWKRYYPPNHYGCRSTVRQLRSGSVTPSDKIPSADIPDMFRTNLGKEGLVFPKDHPYFVDLPDDVRRRSLAVMPYDAQFILKSSYQNGGMVRQHFDLDESASDYNIKLAIARAKAATGATVDLMPTLEDGDLARSIIFHDAKKLRSPDLRIDGVLYEVKKITGISRNSIKHAIDEASHQADHVIIRMPAELDDELINRIAKGRFIDHENLQSIEFRMPGKTVVRKRQQAAP